MITDDDIDIQIRTLVDLSAPAVSAEEARQRVTVVADSHKRLRTGGAVAAVVVLLAGVGLWLASSSYSPVVEVETTPAEEVGGTPATVPEGAAGPEGLGPYGAIPGGDHPLVNVPLEPTWLPEGWVFKGDWSIEGVFGERILTAAYGPEDGGAGELTVSVVELTIDGDQHLQNALDAQEPFPTDKREGTVRNGKPAVIGSGGNDELGLFSGVTWIERPDLGASVLAKGLSEEDSLRIVEGLVSLPAVDITIEVKHSQSLTGVSTVDLWLWAGDEASWEALYLAVPVESVAEPAQTDSADYQRSVITLRLPVEARSFLESVQAERAVAASPSPSGQPTVCRPDRTEPCEGEPNFTP